MKPRSSDCSTNLDLSVQCALFLIKLIIIVWEHLQVVESKLLLYAFLEGAALLQGERVRLGNDRDDVDNIRELLQYNNIDRLQGVAGGLDEEEAAVDTGILDISLSLSSKFLSEVCGVLVLNILYDRVPASLVVDLVTVTRGINNVQPQADTVFLDDVRHSLDLGGRAHWLIGSQSSLRVDQVRCKDRVDQSRLAEAGLS
jgi:hypothetical protein